MLHPVGPLPASVYWRRRAVVLAGAVVTLLVIWLLPGTGGEQPLRPAADGDSAGAAGTPTATTSPGASVTLVATPPTGADPGRTGGDPGDGGSAGSDTDDGTGDGTESPGPAPDPGASSTPPTQAAIPPTCADSALKLTVAAEEPAYPVGTMPVLILSVQNVSRGTCSRDLAAKQQEVLLYAGQVRLWSSNDCYPGTGRDVEALAPGERDRFSVTWSGLVSRPKCVGVRTRVGPGRYRLVGRLGSLQSAPATLVLR